MLRKFNKIILSIIVFVILFSNLYAGELRDKAKNIISSKYASNIVVEEYKLSLKSSLFRESEKFAKQRFFSKFIYYYEISVKDSLVGYAVLDNVLGKVKPITFLIILNLDFSVNTVEVVKYREQHGSAVCKKEWLNQFNEKSIITGIELGENIDGISGATISAESLLRGVKRLLHFISNLGEDERSLLVSIE